MIAKLSTFLLFTFLLINATRSQVVNVESQRMQNDSVKISGNLVASYSYQQNNEEILSQFSTYSTIQLRSKRLKDVFLLYGSYDLSVSNNSTLNNSGFLHFRYSRRFNKFIKWEVFTQIQTNRILLLNKRYLMGTGPRFKIINKPYLKSSFGILYMYEYEKTLENPIQQIYNNRFSSYIALTYTFPNKIIEFNLITYYQPRIDLLSNFRLSNQTIVNFILGKYISLEIGLQYLYNAFPPKGVIKNSILSNMGIKLIF